MERKDSDDTLKSQDLESSLDISNLLYLEKKESNVVTERSQKITYADSPVNDSGVGGGGTIILNLQTGSDYISTKDSYLRCIFQAFTSVGGVPDADLTFGTFGTVLNCFKTVRVISRSGDVVAQIDSANLLNYYKVNYEHTKQWKDQQGFLLGYGSGTLNASPTEFLIPLQLICPFFESEELLPSMLCRGMRLELTLESALIALVQTVDTNPVATYSLSGVQLHLDSYTLTSGAVNWLNDRSANNGLVLTYFDYENSHFSKEAGVTSYAYESRKTASMANSVVTIFRNDRADERKADSFVSRTTGDLDSFQYRVSSLYLPIQPLVGKKSAYNQTQYVLDKLRSGRELGVTLGNFDDLGLMPAILDRYWLDGSGLAINNSTTLVIQGSQTAAVIAAQDVDMFLKHTRSLTIFLQNIRRSS